MYSFVVSCSVLIFTITAQSTDRPNCPIDCRHLSDNFVCGSDGKTYSNPCTLAKAKCLSGGNVTLKHKGACPGTIELNCPHDCSQVPDNPQCGTDGKTYINPCTLAKETCMTRGNITLQHTGECTGHDGGCPFNCPEIIDLKCGTDGKTYDNPCLLAEASCMTHGKVKLQHMGPCTGNDYHCPHVCPKSYDPQCGTDGKTYENGCLLGFEGCMSRGSVTLAHPGVC